MLNSTLSLIPCTHSRVIKLNTLYIHALLSVYLKISMNLDMTPQQLLPLGAVAAELYK